MELGFPSRIESGRRTWFHQPDGTVVAAQPVHVTGNANDMDAIGLSAEAGRCGWWGDPLDLDYTLNTIIANEHGDTGPHYRRKTPLIRH